MRMDVKASNGGPYFQSVSWKGEHETQEDAMACYNGYEGFEHPTLFGVFDGHGGGRCAGFLRENLLGRIAKRARARRNLKEAIRQSFIDVDDEYVDMAHEEGLDDGSTCTVFFVVPNEISQSKIMKFYLACVGDSRAIFIDKDGKAAQLIADHNLDRPDELERVKKSGAKVRFENNMSWICSENGGSRVVTRSIGDVSFKPFVSAEPEIVEGTLRESLELRYAVLGSSGFWRSISNEQVAEIVCRNGVQSSMEKLASRARDDGSEENMTITVIDLQKMYKMIVEYMEYKMKKKQREETSKKREREKLERKKLRGKHTLMIPIVDNNGYLYELLLWENPLRSALWLQVFTFVYFLNNFEGYSMFFLASYLLMAHLLISTFVVKLSPILARIGLLPNDFDVNIHLSESTFLTEELVERASVFVLKFAKVALDRWKYIICEAPLEEFLVAVINISYFFTSFTLATILYIVCLSSFSLPFTYVYNKEYLDGVFDSITEQVDGFRDQLRRMFVISIW